MLAGLCAALDVESHTVPRAPLPTTRSRCTTLNRPKLLKGRKSKKPTVEMMLEESGQDGTEAMAVTEMGSSGELVSQTEEADTPGAGEQMLGGSTMQSGRLSDFDFEIQESEVGADSVPQWTKKMPE